MSHLHDGALLAAALGALGLVVGVLTGLFGVGGGFLITPLLALLLGLPYRLAVGGSLASILGSAASGVRFHARQGRVDFKCVLIMGGGAMIGAAAGKSLFAALEAALGGERSAAFTLTIDGLFIALLSVTAWLVVHGQVEGRDRPPLLAALPLGPKVRLGGVGLEGISLPGLAYVGAGVGVLSGLLGVGGGVLFVPLLMALVGLRTRQAIANSLGVLLLASLGGVVSHALAGNVNLYLAMILLVGSTIGSQIGSAICYRVHAAWLRRWFAVLIAGVIVMLAWNVVGTLWPGG